MSFGDCYRSKKVLVTGNTGFKGSWLTSWLLSLGAEVIGFSKDVPTTPAMYEALELAARITHHVGDLRDLESVKRVLHETKPDFVFHLAAQAIVSRSYLEPSETISTNIIGTMNVLEALRKLDATCVCILITSDKCYDNVEWAWGYRETDSLGGKDIYSGSKGGAELVIRSYFHSFFNVEKSPIRLGIVRAGNVVGGGDWADDRIVADCMRAWSKGETIKIRNPTATRPWQHVLEPLSGYLALGQSLVASGVLSGEAFNFGPRSEQSKTVLELICDLANVWGFDDVSGAYVIRNDAPHKEATLLKLNCDKALFYLNWFPTVDYNEMIKLIGEWYTSYYKGSRTMYDLTIGQIKEYERFAGDRMLSWSQPAK